MNESFLVLPIGIIRTPHKEKYDAPRQPGTDGKIVEGVITLFPHNNYEQALEDISGFERIWILSWFHKNDGWKPKVLSPRSNEKKGVFATRSPHRPNPIGISLCKLLDVDGLNIRVENPDLLDETPILDIKPYVPYADAFPDSKIGWLENIVSENYFSISINKYAQEQIDWLRTKHNIELLERTKEILSRYPFPHSYRRISERENGEFVFAIKSWRIIFRKDKNNVIVEKIESGYGKEKLFSESNEELHNEQAHKEFYQHWKQE